MPYITLVYFFGVFFCTLRFLWQLSLVSKSFSLPNQAHSFFRKINVSDSLTSRDTILKHEQVHAVQLHSADVILFELILIVNWFNPVVYAYKKSVKFIHEFIADEIASTGKDKSDYALLLVSNIFGIQKEQLSNNFYNQSLLKKRIMMLHKSKSTKAAILKYGLSAPLFATMVIFSSATINEGNIESLPVSASSKIVNEISYETITADAGLNTTKQSPETISKNLAKKSAPSAVSKTDTSNAVSVSEVDVMPVYPGGITEFYNWIGKNYKYPQDIKSKQIYGRMMIQFIVEKNGELTDVKTLKDLGYGTAEEAVRLLKSSKAWKPGVKDGKPVRVKFVLPIQLNKPIEVGTTDSQTSGVVVFKKGDRIMSERVVCFLNGKIITKADMEKLDPNTIESMNVIKDKSDFGKYDVPEGTEGIILITLKK
jgi:TonB family protein